MIIIKCNNYVILFNTQAAKARADEAAAAEAEQRAALEEVQAQERARDAKTEELKRKSEDESLGLVARQRAKNELAQHLAEDPLPLRKSKITLEAATKKAEKARIVRFFNCVRIGFLARF